MTTEETTTTTEAPAEATESTTTEAAAETAAPTVEEQLAHWKKQARDNEARAKANAEAAKKLAEIEDAAKSQAEKDAEAKTAAEQRAAKAEADLARLKVATAAQLPPELAERLVGSNEQEMAEDAARLKALMAPATPPAPGGSADQGPQGRSQVAPRQLDAAALKQMTPEQIVEAKAKGQFDDLLKGG